VTENQELFYPSLKTDIWRKCNGTPGFIAAKYFMWLINPDASFKVAGVRLENIESLAKYDELMFNAKLPFWTGVLTLVLLPALATYILCNKPIREQFVSPKMDAKDFTLSILYCVLEQKENV
jgi:hypothetical protein